MPLRSHDVINDHVTPLQLVLNGTGRNARRMTYTWGLLVVCAKLKESYGLALKTTASYSTCPQRVSR